jgi:hypothetical protein
MPKVTIPPTMVLLSGPVLSVWVRTVSLCGAGCATTTGAGSSARDATTMESVPTASVSAIVLRASAVPQMLSHFMPWGPFGASP